MNTAEKILKEDTKAQSRRHGFTKERGFYNSATIGKSPGEIFAFCQDEQNVEKILEDFPMKINNFLDLTLISAIKNGPNHYEIFWKNKPESKVKATLSFSLKKTSLSRGTLLTAEAIFENFHVKGEEPSNLMNIFLKRLKALLETGEIPTTKGQPSGREQLEHKPTLH